MNYSIYLLFFFSFILSADVHLWISSISDDKIEISIKNNANIFGFDFKIKTDNNNYFPIDYFEESFTNGSTSESLYTIDTGTGLVSQHDFTCFTNGSNQLISLSLGNNFLPASDSTVMMQIPILPGQNNANYSIESPMFFSKDDNYNLIDLDVEYGLIEYQTGWPFTDSDKILGAPAIADINQDGFNEIIFCDYFGTVFITNYMGELLYSFDTEDQIWGSPSVSDLNNDGVLEIIVSSKDKYLYILNNQAELITAYFANQYLLGSPAIGNIDMDNDLEIIIGGYSNSGKIFAINMDGTDVEGFPISINEKIQRGVSLADLNQNNLDDIIFGTDSEKVYALYDDGTIAFSTELEGDIRNAPSIIKMNNEYLIVVGSRDDNLYGITEFGEIKFSYNTGDKIDSSPIVLDYNNTVIILFGSSDGYLYAIDTNGQDISGFPINIGSAIESSPVIADFNGDNLPEIVVSSVSNDLHIYDLNGNSYSNIPIIFEFPFSGNPIIEDIDLDGDLEIMVGATNGMVAVDIKDINGKTEGYWHQFRNNLRRTGYIESDQQLNIENSEIINDFLLFNPYPNPFNPTTQINYYIPQHSFVEISVHDIMGKKLDVLKSGFFDSGSYSLIWDASEIASGKYFIYLNADNVKLSKSVTLIK